MRKFIFPLDVPFHDICHNRKPLILDISLMMKAILRHVMISRSVSENQKTPKPVVHWMHECNFLLFSNHGLKCVKIREAYDPLA